MINYGQADAPEGTYKAIATGWGYPCALGTDDTITCWGINYGQADAPEGTYKAIATSGNHSCAIRTDNTITCWGPVPPPQGVRLEQSRLRQ